MIASKGRKLLVAMADREGAENMEFSLNDFLIAVSFALDFVEMGPAGNEIQSRKENCLHNHMHCQ